MLKGGRAGQSATYTRKARRAVLAKELAELLLLGKKLPPEDEAQKK